MTTPAKKPAKAPITALRGQLVRFIGDPFVVKPSSAISHETDGAIVIKDGLIAGVGPAGEVLQRWPEANVETVGTGLILPGFIDCHVHYPQFRIIASYGARLFEWLKTYTFPEELRFADPDYARQIADAFLETLVRNGTTSASVYATVHAHSAEILFEAASRRDMRIATGKMMMDRDAPDGLLDTAQSGYDDSAKLARTWHGKGRATYAISPRFAPTSTPEQLEAAAALWDAYPDALMQTHLAEQPEELAKVKSLFPDTRDYLDVYEQAGLLRPGANFGHAIYLSARERSAICEADAAISHCPTSNLFIGSGIFDLKSLKEVAQSVRIGLATDVAGGSSFSMLATMKAAYEIAQLNHSTLHPVQAWYLATTGSARVMRLQDQVGNLDTGMEADIVVLDTGDNPTLEMRLRQAEKIEDVLFAYMILGDERSIASTYVSGQLQHTR